MFIYKCGIFSDPSLTCGGKTIIMGFGHYFSGLSCGFLLLIYFSVRTVVVQYYLIFFIFSLVLDIGCSLFPHVVLHSMRLSEYLSAHFPCTLYINFYVTDRSRCKSTGRCVYLMFQTFTEAHWVVAWLIYPSSLLRLTWCDTYNTPNVSQKGTCY